MNFREREIKLAYRGLIFEYHPDKIKQTHPEIDADTANRISQIINSAYEVLKNPDKRKEFDEELAALRRQREQARAAEEYRRQREEARARQQEQERENK